ncbi:hypothetical protein JCM21900_004926 [Sporobolomyces salmonicolor]
MPSEPDYNQDRPPTLFAAGTLRGEAVQLDVSSIRPFGDGSHVFVARSTRLAAKHLLAGGETDTVAIKVVEDDKSRRPRNGRREAQLLAKLSHANVLSLLNAYLAPASPSSATARVTLFTPFYPFTLLDLLNSSSFVPETDPLSFTTLAHSLGYQLLSAVSHLHARSIAHRDINPANVALSAEGRAVLIDFGIAVEAGDERDGEMHFEVGTGPYRAPELVFGSRSYDPSALDLWALATTLCELYTPLETPVPPSPSSFESFEGQFYSPISDPTPSSRPQRKTLFQSGGSDFVLAGSIFKVLGTPTIETWPEAAHLPDFSRFSFVAFPPTPLLSHLPHLDPGSVLATILPAMLTCSASKRLSAKSALERLEAVEVVLPRGVSDEAGAAKNAAIEHTVDLGGIVRTMMR